MDSDLNILGLTGGWGAQNFPLCVGHGKGTSSHKLD